LDQLYALLFEYFGDIEHCNLWQRNTDKR